MNYPDSDSPWKAAALTTAIGFDLVLCLLVGYYLGSWVAEMTNGSFYWILGGLFVGLVSAIVSIIAIIKFYGGLR